MFVKDIAVISRHVSCGVTLNFYFEFSERIKIEIFLPLHRSLDSYLISLIRSYDFYLLQTIIELIKVDAHKKSQGIITETKVNLISDRISETIPNLSDCV